MPTRRFDAPIEPMTLGNMRRLGVRSLAVSCSICHHEAIMSAEPWPDESRCRPSGRAWCAPGAGWSAPTRGRTGASMRRAECDVISNERKPNAKRDHVMNKKLIWLLIVSAAAITPADAQDANNHLLHAGSKVTGASVINVVTGKQQWQWQLARPNAAQIAAARRRGRCWWGLYYEWGDCPPGYRPYALTLRP